MTEPMPDARAAARAWLIAIHRDINCDKGYYPCEECVADAILSAPGVEVESVGLALREAGLLHLDLSAPTHTQPVIRLPAQPIEEDGDGHG